MERAALVARLAYKPGWAIKLAGPNHRYLCVFAHCPDSVRPGQWRTTQHQFEIPDEATADVRTFARWAFGVLLEAERHEAAEFFRVDGFAPFFPHHGDDGSPYDHIERWDDQ